MSEFNIILEPKLMFQTLLELENQTNLTTISLYGIALILQDASDLTYAIGFGELIKQAEKDINHFGHAVMAAVNALNTACSEVVNKLVEQFAAQGAKSSYDTVHFVDIQIKINTADRVAIFVMSVASLFQDMLRRIFLFEQTFLRMESIYRHTRDFWAGSSADKTRLAFKNKIEPLFRELVTVLDQIYQKGWIGSRMQSSSRIPLESNNFETVSKYHDFVIFIGIGSQSFSSYLLSKSSQSY